MIVRLLLALLLTGCTGYVPVVPWPKPPAPPVGQPPQPPAPPLPPVPPLPPAPPQPPVPPPAPIPGIPAFGTTKAAVERAWGLGEDIPENPNELDTVVYLRIVDGHESEVHVVYENGRVLRVVVTPIVTPGER